MRELELEERKYRTHVRTLKIGYSVGVLMVAVGLFGLRVLHKGSLIGSFSFAVSQNFA